MRCSLSILLFGLLAACSNDGALGQATLQSGCPANRPKCGAPSFDAPLAAGASLPVAIDLRLLGGGAPPLTLISGDEGVFTVSASEIRGVAPGVASLLMTSGDGVVLDFTSLWVAKATGLELTREAEDGTAIGPMPGKLDLLVGDDAYVAVEPRSNTEPLIGALPVAFTADPAVVSVLDDGVPGRKRLVARAVGTTHVVVSAIGLEKRFDLAVKL
jgi:hypothetical protein